MTARRVIVALAFLPFILARALARELARRAVEPKPQLDAAFRAADGADYEWRDGTE